LELVTVDPVFGVAFSPNDKKVAVTIHDHFRPMTNEQLKAVQRGEDVAARVDAGIHKTHLLIVDLEERQGS
jgi:hypothetical protein